MCVVHLFWRVRLRDLKDALCLVFDGCGLWGRFLLGCLFECGVCAKTIMVCLWRLEMRL